MHLVGYKPVNAPQEGLWYNVQLYMQPLGFALLLCLHVLTPIVTYCDTALLGVHLMAAKIYS